MHDRRRFGSQEHSPAGQNHRAGSFIQADAEAPRIWSRVSEAICYRMNRGGPRAGFLLPESLVQNGTAGDNGTAGGTLNQPVLGFLVG